MPKVRVIVITYNRGHLLGACLESIARQTYRDFEIVAVDDGWGGPSARSLEPEVTNLCSAVGAGTNSLETARVDEPRRLT